MNITYTGQAPSKGHLHDAGLDLKTAHKTTIWPFQRKAIELSTRACLPTGSYAWLTLRSSLANKRGLAHHLGLIDARYTGPLKIIVWNLSFRRVRLEEGERIAQLVPATKSPVELTYTETLPTTSRGEGGFGSTGKGTYFGKEKSSFQADQDDDEDAQSDDQVVRGLAQDLIEAYKTGSEEDVAWILTQLENHHATARLTGEAAQIAEGTKQ